MKRPIQPCFPSWYIYTKFPFCKVLTPDTPKGPESISVAGKSALKREQIQQLMSAALVAARQKLRDQGVVGTIIGGKNPEGTLEDQRSTFGSMIEKHCPPEAHACEDLSALQRQMDGYFSLYGEQPTENARKFFEIERAEYQEVIRRIQRVFAGEIPAEMLQVLTEGNGGHEISPLTTEQVRTLYLAGIDEILAMAAKGNLQGPQSAVASELRRMRQDGQWAQIGADNSVYALHDADKRKPWIGVLDPKSRRGQSQEVLCSLSETEGLSILCIKPDPITQRWAGIKISHDLMHLADLHQGKFSQQRKDVPAYRRTEKRAFTAELAAADILSGNRIANATSDIIRTDGLRSLAELRRLVVSEPRKLLAAASRLDPLITSEKPLSPSELYVRLELFLIALAVQLRKRTSREVGEEELDLINADSHKNLLDVAGSEFTGNVVRAPQQVEALPQFVEPEKVLLLSLEGLSDISGARKAQKYPSGILQAVEDLSKYVQWAEMMSDKNWRPLEAPKTNCRVGPTAQNAKWEPWIGILHPNNPDIDAKIDGFMLFRDVPGARQIALTIQPFPMSRSWAGVQLVDRLSCIYDIVMAKDDMKGQEKITAEGLRAQRNAAKLVAADVLSRGKLLPTIERLMKQHNVLTLDELRSFCLTRTEEFLRVVRELHPLITAQPPQHVSESHLRMYTYLTGMLLKVNEMDQPPKDTTPFEIDEMRLDQLTAMEMEQLPSLNAVRQPISSDELGQQMEQIFQEIEEEGIQHFQADQKDIFLELLRYYRLGYLTTATQLSPKQLKADIDLRPIELFHQMFLNPEERYPKPSSMDEWLFPRLEQKFTEMARRLKQDFEVSPNVAREPKTLTKRNLVDAIENLREVTEGKFLALPRTRDLRDPDIRAKASTCIFSTVSAVVCDCPEPIRSVGDLQPIYKYLEKVKASVATSADAFEKQHTLIWITQMAELLQSLEPELTADFPQSRATQIFDKHVAELDLKIYLGDEKLEGEKQQQVNSIFLSLRSYKTALSRAMPERLPDLATVRYWHERCQAADARCIAGLEAIQAPAALIEGIREKLAQTTDGSFGELLSEMSSKGIPEGKTEVPEDLKRLRGGKPVIFADEVYRDVAQGLQAASLELRETVFQPKGTGHKRRQSLEMQQFLSDAVGRGITAWLTRTNLRPYFVDENSVKTALAAAANVMNTIASRQFRNHQQTVRVKLHAVGNALLARYQQRLATPHRAESEPIKLHSMTKDQLCKIFDMKKAGILQKLSSIIEDEEGLKVVRGDVDKICTELAAIARNSIPNDQVEAWDEIEQFVIRAARFLNGYQSGNESSQILTNHACVMVWHRNVADIINTYDLRKSPSTSPALVAACFGRAIFRIQSTANMHGIFAVPNKPTGPDETTSWQRQAGAELSTFIDKCAARLGKQQMQADSKVTTMQYVAAIETDIREFFLPLKEAVKAHANAETKLDVLITFENALKFVRTQLEGMFDLVPINATETGAVSDMKGAIDQQLLMILDCTCSLAQDAHEKSPPVNVQAEEELGYLLDTLCGLAIAQNIELNRDDLSLDNPADRFMAIDHIATALSRDTERLAAKLGDPALSQEHESALKKMRVLLNALKAVAQLYFPDHGNPNS